MRNRLEKIILSWDMVCGMIALIMAIVFVPSDITNAFCTKIYIVAITVLSIVFSIFFASLTVIMAFPDNEFITFIEKPAGLFTKLLKYFQDTLLSLFVALVFTLIVFIISAYSDGNFQWTKPIFVIFIFIFVYSLFATVIAVDVTLKLTSRRATYLANKKTEKTEICKYDKEKK